MAHQPYPLLILAQVADVRVEFTADMQLIIIMLCPVGYAASHSTSLGAKAVDHSAEAVQPRIWNDRLSRSDM